MERVQYLLDKRIIREVTPIFDTRALGYSSMLVAAKVDADEPAPRGAVHQLAPGRHAQLPAQPRVQPLVHARGRARLASSGLDGTLDVMAAKTGAESIRQLPTLKLFKIRMDLEMEGGTDALKTAGEAVEPMELDPIELSDDDIDGHQGHAGPDGGALATPTRPAAEKLGVPRGRGARAARVAAASAAGCAAWPRSSTTAARASPPTAWASGRCRTREILDTGRRMAAFRGISHCYQRPTYADWPYSVFTMAHGRSKEECDAVLDAIAADVRDRGARDALLEHRVQEGPDALFHRRLQALGSRSTGPEHVVPIGHALGRALPARAARAAGRGQLAGARDARDRPRPDLHRARLRRRADRRRRQRLRRLRLLLGPADPRPRAPGDPRGGHRGRGAGTSYGAPTAGEVELAEAVTARMPSVDMLRMTSSGTEASMSAIRLARAATGPRQAAEVRRRLPRARRRAARRRPAPAWPRRASPPRPACPAAAAAADVVVPWNDPEAVRARVRRARVRGRAGRALSGQHGPDPARAGLPRAAARPLHGLRRAAGLRRGHHRLPRRPGRRAGAHRRAARPDGDGQDPRRRAARRGVRRLGGADGADRARPATSTRRAR